MPFLSLANELIIMIADYLHTNDLNSLLKANTHLSITLTPLLHKRAFEPMYGASVLAWAVLRGYKPLVRIILEKGVDVNSPEGRYINITVLHIAVARPDREMVKLLLDYGADTNMRDVFGNTALHDAVSLGDEFLVGFLLDSGANINAQNDLGRTPLHFAFMKRKQSVGDLLLKRGADISISDNFNHIASDVNYL